MKSSIYTSLRRRLSKARQRTNVVTQDYTPHGRLVGIMIASYSFPDVVAAIHDIASTTSANRVSIAALTPKSWNKSTHNCMDELFDIGLYPPHSALSTEAGATSSNAAPLPNSIQTPARATPTNSVATSSLTLADPMVLDVPSTSLLSSGACVDSSDLATLLFGPLTSEALTFHLPQSEDERTLQEWLVYLPSMALPASDGTVLPLYQRSGKNSLIIFDQVTLLN